MKLLLIRGDFFSSFLFPTTTAAALYFLYLFVANCINAQEDKGEQVRFYKQEETDKKIKQN